MKFRHFRRMGVHAIQNNRSSAKYAHQKMSAMEESEIWVIDPGLNKLAGHHRSLNTALFRSSQNAGGRWRFFAHSNAVAEFPVTACFRTGAYVRGRDWMDWLLRALGKAQFFDEDLQAHLSPNLEQAHPRLLFHSITLPMLIGLARWLELQTAAIAPTSIGLHFHVEPGFGTGGYGVADAMARDALKRIQACAQRDNIMLTITAQHSVLMSAWQGLCPVGIEVAPTPSGWRPVARTRERDERTRLLFIGPPRHEKGFDLLIRALPTLLSQVPSLDVHLLCATEDEVRQASLSALASDRVCFDALAYIPDEQYYSALANADLVYCAYLPGDYAHRPSNIFWEAQAQGVPALVTAGTALASDAKRVGNRGAIVLAKAEPDSLVEACRQAVRDIERYRAEADEVSGVYADLLAGQKWLAIHTLGTDA